MKLHKVGENVKGFRIVEVLEEGYFTFFYRAKKGGKDIFLKQYKEPSSKDPWFNDYLKYELEVKRRVEASKFETIKIVDIFEENNVIYQALEFVPNRKDLWGFIVDHHKPDKFKDWDKQWKKRILYAKMLMDSIRKLHESGIIHSDLKPQNIVLIKDKTVTSGFLFRVADLDWSIIDGRDIPWGYAKGTVGYCSPEHIKGVKPVFVSDVFTCGIILNLLLCDRYPFACKDRNEYKERVLNNEHDKPVLLDEYPNVDNEVICQTLERCLDPDPAKRPTAKEVHKILLGRKDDETRKGGADVGRKGDKTPKDGAKVGRKGVDARKVVVAIDRKGDKARKVVVAVGRKGDEIHKVIMDVSITNPVAVGLIDKFIPTNPEPSPKNDIELTGSIGSTNASIKTDIGKNTLQTVCGEDAKFADTKQYTLFREGDTWFVIPNQDARNETLLNGKKIVEKTPLKPGDQLGVGREEKGIVKAVVTVKLSSSDHS